MTVTEQGYEYILRRGDIWRWEVYRVVKSVSHHWTDPGVYVGGTDTLWGAKRKARKNARSMAHPKVPKASKGVREVTYTVRTGE